MKNVENAVEVSKKLIIEMVELEKEFDRLIEERQKNLRILESLEKIIRKEEEED